MTATTETMNPVEAALLLMSEYLASDTTAPRSLEIFSHVARLLDEMTASQLSEFRTRANELAACL